MTRKESIITTVPQTSHPIQLGMEWMSINKNKMQNHMETRVRSWFYYYKAMEARTKYVRPYYETLRKLVSTPSLIGSLEQRFWNEYLINTEHVPKAPRRTCQL